jgi:hypothetical protein
MHTHSVCRGCLIPRRNDIDSLRVRVLICFFSVFSTFSLFSFAICCFRTHACLSCVFSFYAVWEKKKSITGHTVPYAASYDFPTFLERPRAAS